MIQQRVDRLLVDLGFARSRTLAQRLIEAGSVEVLDAGIWKQVTKTSFRYPRDAQFRVLENKEQRFVSRAGLKLEGALEKTGLDVRGWHALDIGQSTGGFTDCLLQYGCERVVGVDVGKDQIADVLRRDSRVECLEQINAREIEPSLFTRIGVTEFELVVMDVSFISQTLILPRIPQLLARQGWLISLVKPQFEVGPKGIGKGGLVNASFYGDVKKNVLTSAKEVGLDVKHYFESALPGADGNIEFFLIAQKRYKPRHSACLRPGI